MVNALLFGSIGVLAETSEIQRQAYNQSFEEHGLDWYWNIANYCALLKTPGEKGGLKIFRMSIYLMICLKASMPEKRAYSMNSPNLALAPEMA